MTKFGQPFWRETPLEQHEQHLIGLLFAAHHECAYRDNISTHAVMGASVGSADYGKAIISGIASIGWLHAPLALVISLLADEDTPKRIAAAVKEGKRVPGWGDSFNKEEPDPAWQKLDAALKEICPPLHKRIAAITKALHKAGVKRHPNPACYTAAVAMVVEMPPAVAPYFFIVSRLPAWSNLFLRSDSSAKLWVSPPQSSLE